MINNEIYPQFLKRTKEYLIMAYAKKVGEPQINISNNDESFINVDTISIDQIVNSKQKGKFNFYNKYSNISGTSVGSLVNKFKFSRNDLFDLISFFDKMIIEDETLDERCYNCMKFLFGNNIKDSENHGKLNKWMLNVPADTDIYISFYDLKLLGGTSGISFGHDSRFNLPIIIMERATEYVKSDKVIIKTGTLEKQMSGISSIDFKLQPLSLIKDWLFISDKCTFEPNALIVQYKARSKKYEDEEEDTGFTEVKFTFVPNLSDSFYKNTSMFEAQNKFFDWAISAAANTQSFSNVNETIPEIKMRLSSIEVSNNISRNKIYNVEDFSQKIMSGLGFDTGNITILDKITSNDHKTIKYTFVDDDEHDANRLTECTLKAYL